MAGLVTPHALLVHAQGHPDFPLFNALPGAGAVFAPHLLVAFGAQRDRYTSADALQKYAGMAPVTERSGKKSWGHWRLQCPKFLRQTFIAWAAASIRHAFWAQAYDQQQRDKGKAHQTAVRALAFKGIRILYRCWQDRTPYNESISLQALQRRRAPLLLSLVHGSGKDEKTLTAPLRACVRRCAMPPSLKAATAHRMTAPPVCGCQPLQGPVVQHKPWHLLEVTPIPGDQHDVLHQRRRRNAEIATAHAQPHRT
jgi:Transposase IS116/IS110/IS902 family